MRVGLPAPRRPNVFTDGSLFRDRTVFAVGGIGIQIEASTHAACDFTTSDVYAFTQDALRE
eukprot:1630847-Alexandrium_andersonii.AAC.1